MGWAAVVALAALLCGARAEAGQSLEGDALRPLTEIAPLPKLDLATAPAIDRKAARSSCVPYVRAVTGLDIRGDAKVWWNAAAGKYERQQTPLEGAVLSMRGMTPARGHVAVVRKVVGPRLILIDHANWLNQREVTVNVPVEDVSANGDWSQVRVWHIPSKTWGRRIYGVNGFILAEPALHNGV